METGLLVGDAMTKRPITVPKNLTVRECARIMRDKKVGSLLVIDGEELLGIMTEKDMIEKVMAESKDADALTTVDVMTTSLYTIDPAKDIVEAMNIMRDNDIRHLPVVDGNKLEGFLTMKDIIKIEPQLIELILDTIELREESRKLALRPTERTSEGFCEICGNFSEELNRSKDRRMACPECID